MVQAAVKNRKPRGAAVKKLLRYTQSLIDIRVESHHNQHLEGTGPTMKAIAAAPAPRSLWREIIRHRMLLLMVLPAFVYFLVFRYGPILGISIAFLDFKARVGRTFLQSILSSQWVGLGNFKEFLTSRTGVQIFGNTLLISLYKIAFGFPAPIVLALLLNEVHGSAFKRIVQTITYLPHFISWVILAGIIRMLLSPDFGLIVPVFRFLNIEVINFVGDSRYFRGLLVVSDIWQGVGWGSVIYLAALSTLDPQLYEAATIDGANRARQLLAITLPGIAPTIVVMLILRTGAILDAGFDQVFNLQNAAVLSVGDILDTHIYAAGIQQARFSYTTAVGMFKSVFGFLMVLSTNFVAKRLGQQGIM
jgi:putative aldouronate transport system permease protein